MGALKAALQLLDLQHICYWYPPFINAIFDTSALSNIAQAFRNEGLRDPSRDMNGKRHPKIARLLQTYSNEDPPINQQSPLPMSFFKGFTKMKSTPF